MSPIQYPHFRCLCHRSMEIYAAQKSRHCLWKQCFNFYSIPMNMVVGIRFKTFPNRLHRRCFSRYFPQLLELRLLNYTHQWSLPKCSLQMQLLQNIWNLQKKSNTTEFFLSDTAKKLKKQLFSRTRFTSFFSV